MRTRIVLCAGIVLYLAGALQAITTQWAPAPNKNLWSDPLNWSAGVPTSGDKAQFNQPAECIVDFDGAVSNQIDLAGGPLKIVDGGVLTHYNWFIVGYGAGDVGDIAGHVEVHDGGVLDSMARFFVGREGEGHLTVHYGGTVNILGQNLHVAEKAGGTGVVTMEGGTINILEGSDAWGLRHTGNASINFRGGTIQLRDTTQNRDYLASAIDEGVIKAYDGVGEVDPNTQESPGKIIVRGVHPLKPFPSDDGVAPAGDVELSWTLPDPSVPGQPVLVDVYFTDDYDALYKFTDPAVIRIVDKQSVTSVTVKAELKKRYYWAVDTYIGSPDDPILGPIFSFVADNAAPKVSAGEDVNTFLQDGQRTGPLNGSVTDDGQLQPYTVEWTVVQEPDEPDLPDALIDDPHAEQTMVTLYAEGTYIFQLEAYDGEYTSSATTTINVYADDWPMEEN